MEGRAVLPAIGAVVAGPGALLPWVVRDGAGREVDGQDDHDATVVRGGPNKDLSLTQARNNFAAFGASDERHLDHVRPPHDEEHPLK
ncbi:hypothetical protein GCM10018954_065850 [Kutzneria kofuensis]